jgi:hypothetical protein
LVRLAQEHRHARDDRRGDPAGPPRGVSCPGSPVNAHNKPVLSAEKQFYADLRSPAQLEAVTREGLGRRYAHRARRADGHSRSGYLAHLVPLHNLLTSGTGPGTVALSVNGSALRAGYHPALASWGSDASPWLIPGVRGGISAVRRGDAWSCDVSLSVLVSLRRAGRFRNRPLAALARAGHRSSPGRGLPRLGAGFTGAVLCPRENILAARSAGVTGPTLCPALPPDRRKGPRSPRAVTRADSPPGTAPGRNLMNPISITVTGRLGDDPRTFTTRDGTDGVELGHVARPRRWFPRRRRSGTTRSSRPGDCVRSPGAEPGTGIPTCGRRW